MRLTQDIPVQILQSDFSGGIHSRVSTLGKAGTVPAMKDALNMLWRPKRGTSLRTGSRDTSRAALLYPPHSLGKWYAAAGNKTFVGVDAGGGAGKIYRHTASADIEQTMPGGVTLTDEKMMFRMANALSICVQRGNSAVPFFYSATNAAETWLSLKLPKPGSAPTFGANQAGGSLTQGATYYYRVRWNHTNGSSLSSPVSAGQLVVSASGNYTIRVNIPVPGGAARTDYVSWTLERTTADGSAAGPFYRVADGTASTYDDGLADSSLDYESDETVHGEPPSVDGIILHKNRLFGWRGSLVYISQPIVGEEGTGICNWVGDAVIELDKDDGDSITGCIRQGDRLLFSKRRKMHVIEGDDVDSFRARVIFEGAGFAGPRCACSLGRTIICYAGDGRLFTVKSDSVEPFLAEELGDQLNMFDPNHDDDVVLVNYLGDQILGWHQRLDSTEPDDIIFYDLRFGNQGRMKGVPALDALVQVDEIDFNKATLLVVDPVIRDANQTSAPGLNPSFIAWNDNRVSTNQVYIQSLDSNGAPRWAVNGIQVGNSIGGPGQNLSTSICEDGSQGCIVAYLDARSSGTRRDLYAQRFDASGTRQWAAGGVAICALAGDDLNASGIALHSICEDGSGGAVIVWMDARGAGGATGNRLFAQRINSAGVVQWTANGVLIYDPTVSGSGLVAGRPRIIRGGTGNYLVCWSTFNATSNFAYQLLNSSGVPQLTANGVFVAGPGGLGAVAPVKGASNGFHVAFQSTSNGPITVRQLSSAGATVWSANATPLTAGANYPILVEDGAGGVFLGWRENTNTMRAQRLTSTGAILFSNSGVLLCPSDSSPPNQGYGVADGSGGAIFSWDASNPPLSRAQRVDLVGDIIWPTFGVQVMPAAATIAPLLCTDGSGGAIVAALTGGSDISAQRIRGDASIPWGSAGKPVVAAAGNQNFHSICFTDTPQAEFPPSANPGYHVWSVFTGTTDLADIDGNLGLPIAFVLQGHWYDGGMPQNTKEIEWLEVYIESGDGVLSATVEGDDGALDTKQLSLTAAGVTYDSGVRYDDGSVYATSGKTTSTSGVQPGTEGRKIRLTLAGELSSGLELAGWAMDGFALPHKDYA